MEHISIAVLRPDVDAPESKQIKAVVTLIWPYSSSQRQFALLLAEPDLRLRRRKGQVRVRFSSTSARALATTGVGIGDEVVLSLHGAQFVQDGAVSTPGKSVDWELAYKQTLAVSVRRNGVEIANLELIDAAPTPAPRSPVKRAAAAPSPIPQWSSPAFLKRARLSDGPFFEQPAFDPLADAYNEAHDKKRRRKSYRDWSAWTYTARTPSPEKDDVGPEADLEGVMSSPSRPPQLPKTPVSPSRTDATSFLVEAPDDSESVEEATIANTAEGDTTVDDGELQKVHAPLRTSPERHQRDVISRIEYDDPLVDSQYDFGGDTELNTDDEEEDEDVTVPDIEAVDVSATEVATELEDELEQMDAQHSSIEAELEIRPVEASVTEEEREAEVEPSRPEGSSEGAEDTTLDETIPEVALPAVVAEKSLTVAMPPPSLPTLHTDFAVPSVTDLLTPIGREPSSPNLKAVDSATLPLPSPFPGEQVTSYFEQTSAGQQLVPLDGPIVQEQPEADSDADYIMENSFFSSISSSRAGRPHQDHETAFTPVRFTFGMDGTGWSRPLDLSSPTPEDGPSITNNELAPAAAQGEGHTERGAQAQLALSDQFEITEDVSYSSLAGTFDGDVTSALRARNEVEEVVPEPEQTSAEIISEPRKVEAAESAPKPSNVVVLSSDVEPEDSEDESEDEIIVEPEMDRSTDQDTDLESEEEIESESDFESESQTDEIVTQQAPPASFQERAEVDNQATSVASEADEKHSQTRLDNPPSGTQTSEAVPKIVDLGSPSADERSDVSDDNDASVGSKAVRNVDVNEVELNKTAEELPINDLGLKVGPADELPASAVSETVNFDELHGDDATQESAIIQSSSIDQAVRDPASVAIPDVFEESPIMAFDDWEPQLGMDEPLPFIEDYDLPSDTPATADAVTEVADVEMEGTDTHTESQHPDIKMESVEDGPLYQDVPQESVLDPATELVIAVPEIGRKIGELQVKSVPATAPARNTRSKAKSAASPTEEVPYLSRFSTSLRRTRSKASVDSIAGDDTSTTPARGVPTLTTPTRTREVTQTSPYSLRSQSKQVSPDESPLAPQLIVRRSPRNLVRRDTDFDIVPSQVEGRNLFGSIFEPSQELGFGYSQLSQGNYSDVGHVKDSEEDTSHYESSISTVRYSSAGVHADPSDSVEVAEDLRTATPQLKPPPSFLQTHRKTRSRPRSMGQQSVVSPVQPSYSPRRSPRLTRSTFSPTPSPRIARTSTAGVIISSPVPEAIDEESDGEDLPTAKELSTTYLALPTEREGDIRSSPPAPASAQVNIQRTSLLTPDVTQQTAMDPPLSFQARQPEASVPITADSTQSSATATLRSFDIPLPGIETQPAPHSPILRTSPRRHPAATKPHPTSPTRESSPLQQSSDAVSAEGKDETLVAKPDLPSTGLSTPLAYYTPLRDLIYFVNRSSQFHSSSNPDILALCTSASTAPEKAKRGPRHWTTTLHITDLSIWPAARSVNVFRAYQSALPAAEAGDVVLLRAFAVESRSREPVLRSADESSWCVWRYGKPVWGKKGGRFGEVRAREEVKGPVVERGVGEWTEVEKLRTWFLGTVQLGLERQAADGEGRRELRSSSKAIEVEVEEVEADE